MVSYTIEIPDHLHREIQERRHRIDVSEVCREALAGAVASSPGPDRGYEFGRDVAEDITRMFNGG
jgi:hypothetical protein